MYGCRFGYIGYIHLYVYKWLGFAHGKGDKASPLLMLEEKQPHREETWRGQDPKHSYTEEC